MFKVALNLFSITLAMISSKIVYCYTAVITFAVSLFKKIFSSKNQFSNSMDQDELQILQKQISSSFTQAPSCDTFPVSIDSSFNSPVALDVIESQNQRYQEYLKFKVQMKNKQYKQSSQKSSNSTSQQQMENINQIEEQLYQNDNSQTCFKNQNQQFCRVVELNDLYSQLENNENNIQVDEQYASQQQDVQQSIQQQTQDNNFDKNNNQLNSNNIVKLDMKDIQNIQEDEDLYEEDEGNSTDDSSQSPTSDEGQSSKSHENIDGDHIDLEDLNIFYQQFEQTDIQFLKSKSAFQFISRKSSSDQNIEIHNKKILKNQLHNYFNPNFIMTKKLRPESSVSIHDQMENFCSRKRCPCLKFKRRFQRVRPVHAKKNKLPIILENFAY